MMRILSVGVAKAARKSKHVYIGNKLVKLGVKTKKMQRDPLLLSVKSANAKNVRLVKR